jgi:ABC-type dipeptide/oligopeptide/nickel transport systems, permease components
MTDFIVKRILQTILVLVIVTLAVFLVMHSIPGDPVLMYLGPDATADQIAHYKAEFGLDRPLFVQYGRWIANLFRGDLGDSIAFRTPIGPFLMKRLSVTMTIAIPAFAIACLVGVALGIVAAVRRGRLADSIITVVANMGIAMPVFWFSIVCVYFFSLKLKWLPVQGFTFPSENFGLAMRKMVMPVLILAFGPIASLARQTRSAMLEVIQQDYIRTARSKGVAERRVIYRHGLRNALIPVVTVMGMMFGSMVGGAILVEQVFVIPGMGTMLITAIVNKDYLLVQSGVLVIAACISLCNLIVDVAYGYIDPRIRIS